MWAADARVRRPADLRTAATMPAFEIKAGFGLTAGNGLFGPKATFSIRFCGETLGGGKTRIGKKNSL